MKFTYRGPVSGITLKTEHGQIERMLFPGHTVDLPADHPQVTVMEARGHLTRVLSAPSETRTQADLATRSKRDNKKGGNE